MNRLFIVVGLIFVCVIGAGFYFGYLRIGSDSAGGLTHITLTWDRTKLEDDEKKALERVHDFGHQVKK